MTASNLRRAAVVLLMTMATLSQPTMSISEDLPVQPVRPQQGPGELTVGQAFPDLVLPRLGDGEPISIAAFRGKKVILHLFASW